MITPDGRDWLQTPVVELDRLFPDAGARIFAKLDQLQVAGSTKERTAASLLDGAEADGRLLPGGTVVESSSGNLGIALARHCALRGYRFVAVVDANANAAAVRMMTAFGAGVERVAPADGNLLAARRRHVQELLAEIDGAVTTDQYGSPYNPRAHETSTMPEFLAAAGTLDTLFVATSTTGTLVGCHRYLRAHGLGTRLVAVDAAGSVLFGGAPAPRRLPGLGAGILPALHDHARPDETASVPEPDMIWGCRRLARTEGLLAGASTGAIVAALARHLAGPGAAPGERVGLLVHDSGVPYLDTVYDDGWVAEAYPDAAAGVLGTAALESALPPSSAARTAP
ncbi:pyridoxal-phosphate dependent enzyme [Zhihengliuella salsuginis]|uniref:Cysteine synthase n=1 Tax=Zhihengliuella salsuginis TaxID=578222 RepID=A0ABQ3GBG9_9MICC|nr:pyridoxal-phosphate dependent enzyme [Zhihengliuella salsuginis]GHC99699.1 cysteine synthase [Zhihengliuella salsuginis]